MNPKVKLAVRIILGLALLAFVLSRANLSQLTVRMDGRLALALVATVVLLFVAQGASAVRWSRILGASSPPSLYLWRLYAIGAFFSLFLPTVVGGDAVRAVALSRSKTRTGAVLASVVLDRGFGVLALVIYLIIGALVAPALLTPVWSAAHWKLSPVATTVVILVALAGLAAAAVVVRRSEKIRTLWVDGFALVQDLLRRPADLFVAVALGFLVQGAYILAWMVLAAGLRFELPPVLFLVAVPVVSLATMLPVTFAGIGLREGAWVLLLRGSALQTADIVVFSLLYFAGVLVVGAIGGLVFVARGTEPAGASAEVPAA